MESSKSQLCQYSSETIFVSILLGYGMEKKVCVSRMCVCVRLSPAVSLQTLVRIQFSNAHFLIFDEDYAPNKIFLCSQPLDHHSIIKKQGFHIKFAHRLSIYPCHNSKNRFFFLEFDVSLGFFFIVLRQ